MASFQPPASSTPQPMSEWEAHMLSRICAGESLFFPDDARLKIQQLFQSLDSGRTGKLEATDFQVPCVVFCTNRCWCVSRVHIAGLAALHAPEEAAAVDYPAIRDRF